MQEVTQTSRSGANLDRFAAELGLAHPADGTIWFSVEDGPQVVLEPIDDGRALALHTSLGAAPRAGHEEMAALADLLASNAPDVGHGTVAAIDPVSEDLMLFKRLHRPADLPYEEFSLQLFNFAEAARRRRDGFAPIASPQEDDANEVHEEAFRQLWSEYVFARGLSNAGGEPQAHDPYLITPDEGGYLFVELDPATGSVLLKAVLAFLPLDELDDDPMLRQLLEAHLLGEATGGASFAIDEVAGELIACKHLHLAELSAHELGEEIDDLAMTAARFARMLAITLPGTPTDFRN
ncbi:MAG: type III secretion system chaperone [Pseudomonadota bacterium]